ncbi:hypothetical protein GDO81_020686 [Engystomops pustulosus]|uniref:Uncharacterized protein n=1 Tax=Engystomops pustulosus TaxID=76066 RepID=A0AAV6ZBJ6_ENGPU|nr:hypothetical protein GDO81_020686 [Engystomops pustulosus]
MEGLIAVCYHGDKVAIYNERLIFRCIKVGTTYCRSIYSPTYNIPQSHTSNPLKEYLLQATDILQSHTVSILILRSLPELQQLSCRSFKFHPPLTRRDAIAILPIYTGVQDGRSSQYTLQVAFYSTHNQSCSNYPTDTSIFILHSHTELQS